MNWLFAVFMVFVAGLLLYWLLVITEGVYLGRRVVAWLYDVTARKYDDIKQFDVEHEHQTISGPLLRVLDGRPSPWVLDVGTGTGRVPALLLQEPGFKGRVVGLDAAGKMLALASRKFIALPGDQNCRVALVQQTAAPLPFPDNTFDAVTCLEALEFFPSDVDALQEMVRVLRPGGFLMTTRRRGLEARLFVGRYRSTGDLERILVNLGLLEVETNFWQVNYDLVTAWKGKT